MGTPGATQIGALMAGFTTDKDLTPLFPFINAVNKGARLHKRPAMIRFNLANRICALYARWGMATPFDDRTQAAVWAARQALV